MHSWPDAGVRRYIEGAFPACLREPSGNLPFPYVDPGAGYTGILWDWDAFFCLVGLAPWASQVGRHAQGCVRNFLAFQGDDGHVPFSLTPQSVRQATRPAESPRNSAKPLLAQLALLAAGYLGEEAWLADSYDGLCRHMAHWETTQASPSGLFTFRSHRGSGSDNHPGVYGRPFDSSADVFLNSLAVREYRALAHLAALTGHGADAAAHIAKADALADAVRGWLWDPIDGLYYNIDVGRGDAGVVNQPITWAVPLKFRMWTTVMPLWAGIAAPEHAARVVEHLLNPAEFRSDYGVRSLARNEPAYSVFTGSNPSDWQGPIWVVANYLAFRGLLNYGYRAEAEALAVNLLAMLTADIDAHGCLHEYYDPETGAGLTHPGFLNWNTLAAVLGEEWRTGTDSSAPWLPGDRLSRAEKHTCEN